MTIHQVKQEALQTVSRFLAANHVMQANEAAIVYRTLCEAEQIAIMDGFEGGDDLDDPIIG